MRAKWIFAAATAAALGMGPQALANTMSVTYYQVSGTNDKDFNNPAFCCSGRYTNEALGSLGTDGLPLYNAAYGGPAIQDVNGAGEITWWSPGFNANVTQTGTGTVTLPISNGNMYPPNGTGPNDANGFETAVLKGVLHVPTAETVTFDLGSDDDALLYLNGNVIDQVGGVHPVWDPGVITETLAAGNYNLSLFYADRYQVAAVLDFSVNGDGVTLNGGVPEPATWAMMVLGVGAMGASLRRARRKTAAA